MHPLNMGRLALGTPGPLPCTPAGIEALLAHHGIPVAGRELVILGRGATLGRPLAMLMAQKRPTANAAVTVVHTGVADWPRYTRRADILVAAAGVPGLIRPGPVRPGAGGGCGGGRWGGGGAGAGGGVWGWAVGGAGVVAGRGRVVRRGGGGDHAAGGRGGPDDG